jgi:hypothetical protein
MRPAKRLAYTLLQDQANIRGCAMLKRFDWRKVAKERKRELKHFDAITQLEFYRMVTTGKSELQPATGKPIWIPANDQHSN